MLLDLRPLLRSDSAAPAIRRPQHPPAARREPLGISRRTTTLTVRAVMEVESRLVAATSVRIPVDLAVIPRVRVTTTVGVKSGFDVGDSTMRGALEIGTAAGFGDQVVGGHRDERLEIEDLILLGVL